MLQFFILDDDLNGLDFDNMPDAPTEGTEFKPAEITEEETANIRKMLEELGL